MKIAEVLETPTWRFTRVETPEYTFYIEETLLFQVAPHPTPAAQCERVWAKTAIYSAVKPEAMDRIIAAQAQAQVKAAEQVRNALNPCEECHGKPERLTTCWKCRREG